MAFGRLTHLFDSEEEEDDDDENDSRYGRHLAPGDGGHDGPLIELKGGVHNEVVHIFFGFLEVVAQLEVEKGVSGLHVGGGLHLDGVLCGFVDEQEVEGVVSRGVHHVLFQPEVDSSNCEKLVPACVRLVDSDSLSLGDISPFPSSPIHLAGELSCLGGYVDAMPCVDEFGTVPAFSSRASDLKFPNREVKVKCWM